MFSFELKYPLKKRIDIFIGRSCSAKLNHRISKIVNMKITMKKEPRINFLEKTSKNHYFINLISSISR